MGSNPTWKVCFSTSSRSFLSNTINFMARLKVFISSTYYDLKHIRSTMETFVEDMGYEAVLSEKGSIAYNPAIALDESCYRDAQACDILVLIIGGRYGAAASSEKIKPVDFYDRYDSITKREFESAIEKDIPVYILVEKMVYGEFETFKKNRENKEIKYAHVQNVNVFLLIDEILSKPKNNAVFHFEKHSEIIGWLKLQWSGYFKDLLSKKSESKQISSLSEQVKYLSEINTTLKRYMEEILSSTGKKIGKDLIDSETRRLEEIEVDNELKKIPMVVRMMETDKIQLSKIKEIIESSASMNDFIKRWFEFKKLGSTLENLISYWKKSPELPDQINQARAILGLPTIGFVN